MRLIRFGVLLGVLHAACAPGVSPVSPDSGGDLQPPPRSALVRQIASGGYVLFFRHAERDANAMTVGDLAMADNAGLCAPGSELTPKGIQDAMAIGAAFRALGLRVDRVFASPTCRTTQMATLAFGAFETTRALTWPDMWSDVERSSLVPELRALLARVPAPGANIVLISHNNVLQASRVGLDLTLEQGECAIFQPTGDENIRFIGRIPLQEWEALRTP